MNTDSQYRLKIIQSLTKFVPGILSVCSLVVKATDTQHHSITVVSYYNIEENLDIYVLFIIFKAALKLWSTITSLIICDGHMLEDCNPFLGELLPKNENGAEKQLNDWIQENSDNFHLVSSLMTKTREHQHWRVRLQLAESCDLVINKCTR